MNVYELWRIREFGFTDNQRRPCGGRPLKPLPHLCSSRRHPKTANVATSTVDISSDTFLFTRTRKRKLSDPDADRSTTNFTSTTSGHDRSNDVQSSPVSFTSLSSSSSSAYTRSDFSVDDDDDDPTMENPAADDDADRYHYDEPPDDFVDDVMTNYIHEHYHAADDYDSASTGQNRSIVPYRRQQFRSGRRRWVDNNTLTADSNANVNETSPPPVLLRRRLHLDSSSSASFDDLEIAARQRWMRQNWAASGSASSVLAPAAFQPVDDGITAAWQDTALPKLPGLWRENRLQLGNMNKIFASLWLDSNKIVFGTKCNNIYVLDLSCPNKDDSISHLSDTGYHRPKLTRIPSLSGLDAAQPYVDEWADIRGGVRSLQLNPSRTLLAVGGAEDVRQVAVYRVPDFRPVAVGRTRHSDWIFDVKFLDDQFLVSGSRDGSLSLFRFNEDELLDAQLVDERRSPSSVHSNESATSSGTGDQNITAFSTVDCIFNKKIKKMDKIRAITFSSNHKILSLLSSNSTLCLLDARSFRQISRKQLNSTFVSTYANSNVSRPFMSECVCMAHDGWGQRSTVVGSRNGLSFVDSRTMSMTHQVPLIKITPRPAPDEQSGLNGLFHAAAAGGVRSISWRGSIVTAGTGEGQIVFYDVRNCRYLDCFRRSSSSQVSCQQKYLKISDGWLNRDDSNYRNIFSNSSVLSAVYSHCYDDSGMRLFAAGGPIAELLIGNYAAVWQ